MNTFTLFYNLLKPERVPSDHRFRNTDNYSSMCTLTDLAAAPTIAKLNEILKHANIDSVLQGSQWNNFEKIDVYAMTGSRSMLRFHYLLSKFRSASASHLQSVLCY